jgi:hypothetical protein
MYYFIGSIIILRLYYILCPVNNLLKYFFINIIHSLIISIYTYPVILEILNNPIQKNMYQHIEYIPNDLFSFLTALHIYHMIYYNIDYNELEYYILSIYFHFFPLNKFLVAGGFFMLGIPNGIFYTMAILINLGYIQRNKLNIIIWCKVLGILFFTSLLFLNIYISNKNNKFILVHNLLILTFMICKSIKMLKSLFIS